MIVARPARFAVLAAASLLTALPTLARAGTFDAAGNFVPDPNAVFTDGFDVAVADNPTVTLGAEAGGPIEGAGYIVLDSSKVPQAAPGQPQVSPYLELPLPASLEPGTYTLRFLARHNRVVGGVTVAYTPVPTEHGDPSFYATAYPTGVVTSDGWYEVATAPFTLDPARAFSASIFLYATQADLDALELVKEAAPAVASKACGQAFDPVCSESEFCETGFCRDGNVTVPSIPPGELGAGSTQLAAYWKSRLDLFFGGQYTRENRLALADQVLDAIPAAASRWELWNGIATSMHRLRDWHTSFTGPTDFEGRGAFPLCVVEGDADLTHAVAPKDPNYPDVLVSHGSPDPVASSNLGPGDRIVSVDGQHPFAWMDSLDSIDWGYWHSIDPDGHAEAAERLLLNIRRFAHELVVVRCDRTAHTCANATETLLIANLPADQDDTVYPACDHRPSYLIDGPDPVTHRVHGNQVGMVHGTTADEAINGMTWNNVNAQTGNPFATALSQLTTGAKGVILDHRTGNGGTEYAAELLTQPFRAPALLGASTGYDLTIGVFDAPFDGLALFQKHENNGQDGYNVGSTTYDTTLKTALLLARDGSASDWFPRGLKGAPNVRIFGRHTAGAFSSFLQFDYFGNLVWQFGSGDFINADGTPQLGHGIQPDEEIFPAQSDLIQGKDTVALRALAWIRGEGQQ